MSLVTSFLVSMLLVGSTQAAQPPDPVQSQESSRRASAAEGSVTVSGSAVPRYSLFTSFLVSLETLIEELSPGEFASFLEERGLSPEPPCLPELLSWRERVRSDQRALPPEADETARLLVQTELLGELYGLLLFDLRRMEDGDRRVETFVRYLTEVRARGTTVRVAEQADPIAYLEQRQRAFWRGAARYDIGRN
jgi:hypothetical protein